jgi:hypothetical protein
MNEPRRHDTDGRRTLSQTALIDLCRFFLDGCIDQIAFYRSGLGRTREGAAFTICTGT